MANKIKFIDLKKQYSSIGIYIDAAIQKVLDSGNFIGGEEVEKFEKEVAKFCDVKYAIGVNSGTDALFLSLKALGIGSGDEVITSPFTFIATAEVIANLGAKPVFADIESDTFNISPSKIEEYLKTKNYKLKAKVIIPVHLFGQIADMEEVMRIAKKYRLKVIEDAAQAIGAEYKKKKAATIGDLGCFSFFPSKNLGAYGDGGMVITNNKRLAEKIRLLRNHGSSQKNKYKNLILGTNSRLDVFQASVLRVKLKYLKKWNQKRQEIANLYNKELKEIGDIITPFVVSGRNHIFHQYVITTKYRDKLKEYLAKQKIQTMIYYSIPLHLQPVFKHLGYKKGDFSNSERLAKEVLSLPIYPEIKKEEIDFIIKKIKNFYDKK
ncbi:DegT/DnrJ/EryC1/StrS family aminotransferase [Patescibacteria group bacterium]|nr:DegT/DnrJ/EryC1/StrS family aminotransferase [Patescibacteria group bacterium]